MILAGVWQGAGFAMALFLAGLRSVDGDLIKAAQIDGAGPWRTYRRVVLPTIWPIFVTVFVILLQSAIKTFDLVRALTGGGPGISTMLPTLVVYDFMFQRSELGRGSAAAVLMLLSLVVVLVPYGLFMRWRRQTAGPGMKWTRVDRLRGAGRAGAAVPGAAGVVVAELAALQPGDRLHLDDRLAASSDLRQLSRGLEPVLHGRALLGHRSPTCSIR